MPSRSSLFATLHFKSHTSNYARWDGLHGNVTFSLYVPSWRVPHPTPTEIRVFVVPRRAERFDGSNLTRQDVDRDGGTAWEPIVTTVKKSTEDVNKIQYVPIEDGELAQALQLHIPRGLTSNEAELLRLIVLWD